MFPSFKANVAAAALAAFFLAGLPVLAQDPPPPPPPGARLDGQSPRRGMRDGRGPRDRRGPFFGRAAALLGLTDEQRTRIEEIHKANGEAMRAAHDALRAKRQALDEAMSAEPANQATIDARIADVSAAHAAMLKQMTATRMQMLQVLTPDQRTRLRDAGKEPRGPKGPGRHGRRGGPGGPGSPDTQPPPDGQNP